MNKIPKELTDLLISVYEIGYFDRDAKLMPYNNLITNEEKIEYIEAILFPEEEKQTNNNGKL